MPIAEIQRKEMEKRPRGPFASSVGGCPDSIELAAFPKAMPAIKRRMVMRTSTA